MTSAESSSFARRLPRQSALKTRNIRLDKSAEAVLSSLKHHLRGERETDIPSSSVILRRALTIYGNICLPLNGQPLTEERKALIAQTYLPLKRRPKKTV